MIGKRPRGRAASRAFWCALAGLLLFPGPSPAPRAQEPALTPLSDPSEAVRFEFHRPIRLGGQDVPPVVVSEFFTHGALAPDGSNLRVVDGRRRAVPWRLLQVGPGDFVRVAVQTVPRVNGYQVEYGGDDRAPKAPEWTSTAGLVMETRRFIPCDLNRLASVRDAFSRAEPIGSVFVPAVFLAFNPASPGPEPFFSVFKGTLRAPVKGVYQFFTSSQDCSFLLVDGAEVASAPGAHGPTGQARFKGAAALNAGPHGFEYVHAASGPGAMMVAAWQPPGAEKPEPIPAAAFGSGGVAVVPVGGPVRLGDRPAHDFTAEVTGEVSWDDDAPPLVRVRFRSSVAVARVHWDFGDGQTGTGPAPWHVYLHPGLYPVRLSVPGEASSLAVTNRVMIGRPAVFPGADHPPEELPAYLPLLRGTDASQLDPAGVLQLVRVRLAVNQAAEAAASGRAALAAGKVGADAAALKALIQLVGPLLRDRLDDAPGAFEAWTAAARAAKDPVARAWFEAEAADIALHDLLRTGEAKALLDAATAATGPAPPPDLAARLFRVRGDWHARMGDKAAAVAAYARADAASAGGRRPSAVRSSWRGALSRSAEAFLRDKQLDRALAELRRWQDEYPSDKQEGDLSLLQARERAARGKYAAAVAYAGDLIAVNPDSPYADRLVFLAAECHEKLGRRDRALAGYRSLVNDYPGSPLVGAAGKQIDRLSSRPPPVANGSGSK